MLSTKLCSKWKWWFLKNNEALCCKVLKGVHAKDCGLGWSVNSSMKKGVWLRILSTIINYMILVLFLGMLFREGWGMGIRLIFRKIFRLGIQLSWWDTHIYSFWRLIKISELIKGGTRLLVVGLGANRFLKGLCFLNCNSSRTWSVTSPSWYLVISRFGILVMVMSFVFQMLEG